MGIFQEDFFGRNFLKEFFVSNFLGCIFGEDFLEELFGSNFLEEFFLEKTATKRFSLSLPAPKNSFIDDRTDKGKYFCKNLTRFVILTLVKCAKLLKIFAVQLMRRRRGNSYTVVQ